MWRFSVRSPGPSVESGTCSVKKSLLSELRDAQTHLEAVNDNGQRADLSDAHTRWQAVMRTILAHMAEHGC